MVALDIENRLKSLAKSFEEARGGRSGREVRRYPVALWMAVAKLEKAGVPHATLCERCGFALGTLTNALGRLSAQDVNEPSRIPSACAVKTLEVEASFSPSVTCEILFPNGVVIRVDVGALGARLLENLRSC